jgi:hypothetical protein
MVHEGGTYFTLDWDDGDAQQRRQPRRNVVWLREEDDSEAEDAEAQQQVCASAAAVSEASASAPL